MWRKKHRGTLLVASTGGHLEQLCRIAPRLHPQSRGSNEWATFDSNQARELLSGERVHFVRYTGPRDYRSVAANVAAAREILQTGYDRVISTGAGVAIPFVVVARMTGIPCHYIESAARGTGPSLTGKVLSRIPGVHLYTQYDSWADRRWRFRGNVFDAFAAQPASSGRPVRRVVVTLGTLRKYQFQRAIRRLVEVLPAVVEPGAEVLWQAGGNDVGDLPIAARESVPRRELRAAIGAADLVISHGGVGSALLALEGGRAPVLLPRLAIHGEHVDDHQELIARELAGRGLAVRCEADGVTESALRAAASMAVAGRVDETPFRLGE